MNKTEKDLNKRLMDSILERARTKDWLDMTIFCLCLAGVVILILAISVICLIIKL